MMVLYSGNLILIRRIGMSILRGGVLGRRSLGGRWKIITLRLKY